MNREMWINKLESGGFDGLFAKLYGGRSVNAVKRYVEAIEEFCGIYGDGDIRIFSAPGRTEIAGNHTDHNHGIVLAGSVNLDMIAVVMATSDNIIELKSQGFEKIDHIKVDELSVVESEKEHSASLIRGICKAFLDNGGKIGGFKAYSTNDVLRGSGLSSSAAFEVCIGAIINGLYNEGAFSPVDIAIFGQYAENVYFGKPSGLMDQTACAVGGVISIDFEDTKNPIVEQVDLDLEGYGYELCITDTGGNHADLTNEYASIPIEMREVAKLLGKTVLRELSFDIVMDNINNIRTKLGDRYALRAIHFFKECDRVKKAYKAAKCNNIEEFFSILTLCGHSSFEYLQNAYVPSNSDEQNIPIALAVSQNSLNGKGATRLQGGGFAGTIQAFVPKEMADIYQKSMEAIFGEGNCHRLIIRSVGICEVI